MDFARIPANLKVPLFYAEFDNSAANQGDVLQPYKALFIAPKLAAGSRAVHQLDLISNVNDAIAKYGAGSVLADMIEAYNPETSFIPLYAMAVADDGAGVKAKGEITVSGTPTEAGTISYRIGGRNFKVPVTLSSTPTTLAVALRALINADSKSVVSALAVGGTPALVEVEAKNAGLFGNEISISDSHFDGEKVPAGLTITYGAMTGGLTNPNLDAAIAAIGPTQFLLIGTPFSDAENLTKIETEGDRRFGPIPANDGFHIVGKKANYAALVTLGSGRNSQFTTFVAALGPSNPWQWAANEIREIAASASNDPARPFQTLVLNNVIAPKLGTLFTIEERNNLIENGISTFFVDAGGKVNIESVVTTYKQNAFGSPDESYKYLNTLLTLSYLRFDLKATITQRYPRHKLANNGTQVAPGQAVVTPNDIKALIILKYRSWESRALVENFDLFKSLLIVERNAQNPNRVDVLLPPDLVNQLIVVASKIQFRL